jgi:hypothetical protein
VVPEWLGLGHDADSLLSRILFSAMLLSERPGRLLSVLGLVVDLGNVSLVTDLVGVILSRGPRIAGKRQASQLSREASA